MNIKWMAAGVFAVALLFSACGDDAAGDDNDGGGVLDRSAAATPAPNSIKLHRRGPGSRRIHLGRRWRSATSVHR